MIWLAGFSILTNYFGNKLCVIAGATSGLGRSLCEELSREKASLLIIGRDHKRLQEISENCTLLGASEVKSVLCDFAVPMDVKRIVKLYIEEGTIPFLFVHCAAQNVLGDFESVPIDRVDELFQVNTFSVLRFLSALIPRMKRSKGHVVLISSGTAYFSPKRQGIYSATKASLERIGESLIAELEESPLTVTIIHPGPISTPLLTDPEVLGSGVNVSDLTSQGVPAEVVAKKILKGLPKNKNILFVSIRPIIVKWLAALCPWVLRFILK
jgi:short-subunit dehydrogenase